MHSFRTLRWRSLLASTPLWFSVVIFVAGMSLTQAVRHWIYSEEIGEARIEFERAGNAFTVRLQSRLQAYDLVLRAAQGLYASSGINRRAWHAFIDKLDLGNQYPGIQEMSYSPLVEAGDLPRYLARRRAEGEPWFKVFPPGRRAYYQPVGYIAPESPVNLRALGYDMASNQARRATMDRARDQDSTAMSGKIELIQDDKTHRPGFLMFHPLYRGEGDPPPALRRSRHAGFIVAAFRMRDFVQASLPQASAGAFELKMFDATMPPGSESLMFDSAPDLERGTRQLHYESAFGFGGGAWHVAFDSTPAFDAGIDHARSRLVLLSGSLITLLLTLLAWSLAGSRARALLHAAAMTADLRVSQERFQLVIGATAEGIWDRDLVGGTTYVSPRFEEMFGYRPGELVPKIGSIRVLIHPDDLARWETAVQAHLERHQGYDCEYRARRADGEWRWFRSRGQAVWDADGKPLRMVGSLSDITEMKLTALQLDRQREYLARLIDAIPEPIVVKDRESRFVLVNRAYAEKTGRPAADMIGKTTHELLPADSAAAIVALDRRLLETGEEQTLEIRLYDARTLSQRDTVIKKSLALGPDDEPLIVSLHSDVTELRRTLARFEAVVNDTPLVAVIGMDRSGTVDYWNRACETLYALPRGEALGRKVGDLPFTGEVGANFHRLIEKVWTSGQPTEAAEYLVPMKNGKRVWILSALYPVIENGAVAEVFGMGIDISARKRGEQALKESEERFRHLTEMSSDWFWEQDSEFRFTELSGGIYTKGGISAQQSLGKTRWELPVMLPAEEWAAHRAVLEMHLPFRDFEYQIQGQGGADDIRWYSASGEPQFDSSGAFAGYRGVGKDITVRRRAEEELRRHRDHLEELVAAQTAHLLRAKNEAERANQAKSEFLANMSHELRTPMHAILSFSRLGSERQGTVAAEKLAGYFARIRQSGERLLALINDLLDLSKLESGKMVLDRKPSDLVAIVGEALAEFEPLIADKHLHVDFAPSAEGAHANVDALLIGQVVRNLLSNAVKFSPADSSIRITMDEAELHSGRRANDVGAIPAVRLRVIDAGIGIPPDELEAVFDKFIQSSKTRSGAGGTGLGLAICNEIVEAHQGSICAKNNASGGTTFEVLLPRGGK